MWVLHSRLARLVVGPFWAWIWTGGGPSVHWKKTNGGTAALETCWKPKQHWFMKQISRFLKRSKVERRQLKLHVHWWGYVQGGCRRRCGPAAAAGRNSGASVQPHGLQCCFQGPCSSLQAQQSGFLAQMQDAQPGGDGVTLWKMKSIPFNSAEDQSCTDMSGILLASCMAGTTMLLLS